MIRKLLFFKNQSNFKEEFNPPTEFVLEEFKMKNESENKL